MGTGPVWGTQGDERMGDTRAMCGEVYGAVEGWGTRKDTRGH